MLTVLLTVILSHFHISLIFCYCVFCTDFKLYQNSTIKCNIVQFSYFPHVLLLHNLYIELQTVKYINCIINCNIVQFSYFPHVLLLHNLYIQLQTVNYITRIINCNIVQYSYFSNFL